MTFSPIETEAIAIRAIIDSVDSMVNWDMMSFTESGEARCLTTAHQELLMVRLADFLEKNAPEFHDIPGSSLDAVQFVAQQGGFESHGSAENLRKSASVLADWLGTSVVVKTWFSSLDMNVDLCLERRDMITVCGNIAKHNPARLTGIAGRLAAIMRRSGAEITGRASVDTLEEFYQRFGRDVLIYHTSTIAELLNSVRWGIHDYLVPQFQQSFAPQQKYPPHYTYRFPTGLNDPFAQACFWDIMNRVRAAPLVPRFTTPQILKGLY